MMKSIQRHHFVYIPVPTSLPIIFSSPISVCFTISTPLPFLISSQIPVLAPLPVSSLIPFPALLSFSFLLPADMPLLLSKTTDMPLLP